MQIPLLRHRMLVLGLGSLFLAVLTLAACGGGASTPASEEAPSAPQAEGAAEETAKEQPQEVAQAEQAEAEAEPAPTDVAQQESSSAPSNSPAVTCQGVTVPENQLIAAASDNDWVKGPADAAVTVIEYGDFQ